MLSNMGEKENFTVRLLPEKLGLKTFSKLKNVENLKSISIKDNTFSVEVPRHDFCVLIAE